MEHSSISLLGYVPVTVTVSEPSAAAKCLNTFLGCLFVSGHTDSRREGVGVMQFGSHYTLFRQDRRTIVRSEIAKASSNESTVCSGFIISVALASPALCKLKTCSLTEILRSAYAAAQDLFAVCP